MEKRLGKIIILNIFVLLFCQFILYSQSLSIPILDLSINDKRSDSESIPLGWKPFTFKKIDRHTHYSITQKENKIAIEVYGVIIEHFAYSEEIRNERISRIEDGKGTSFGDLYFSTLIQIFKDRKFPNTLLRFATKTASGDKLEGARHTDSPGYFCDLSFSEELRTTENMFWRPFGSFGFYTWQTNDELNLQNDAFMYALGLDLKKSTWLFSSSWSGYTGYKDQRDRPMQLNFELRKDYSRKAFRLQYHHGLRDWNYKTIKISFLWKINPVN